MSLLAAIVWTTGGSVAGALVLYWIGALIGRSGPGPSRPVCR